MSCPAPRPNEVIRAVRPEAEPLMRRLPTSTVTTEGRLTVCAVPRVHIAASWHTNTASIVHFMGAEPSYGAAASATDAPTRRMPTSIRALTLSPPALNGLSAIIRPLADLD